MKKLGNKIVNILAIDDENFFIKLRFKNGFIGAVSLSHLFNKPVGLAREILKGNMFSSCFIESGALAWPNGFELCPDAVFSWAIKQHKRKRFSRLVKNGVKESSQAVSIS